MKPGPVLIAFVLAAGASQAQPVYRCGNAYSDKPCPDAKVIDAEPNKGMEVRGPGGAVIHSREGDKGRNARSLEQMHENIRNALNCGIAGDPAAGKNGRLDCPTVKAQQDAKRLTPDYIRK